MVEDPLRQRLLAAAVEAIDKVPQQDFLSMLFVATQAVEEMHSLGLEKFLQKMSGWDLRPTQEEVLWLVANIDVLALRGVSASDLAVSNDHSILELLAIRVLRVPAFLPLAISVFLISQRNFFEPFACHGPLAQEPKVWGEIKNEYLEFTLSNLKALSSSAPGFLVELKANLTRIRNATRTDAFQNAMSQYRQSLHHGQRSEEAMVHLRDGWETVQKTVGAGSEVETMLGRLMWCVEHVP